MVEISISVNDFEKAQQWKGESYLRTDFLYES